MISQPAETIAPKQSKTERKVDGLVKVIRRGELGRASAMLRTLPLEKARVIRSIAAKLEQLAAANDRCLIALASALCQKARNTAAAPEVVRAINSAAQLLFDSRHLKEAADLFQLSLAFQPAQQPSTRRQLARVLGSLGERPEAVAVLLPLLLSNPAMVSAATIMARLADESQMAEIGERIGPLAVAHAATHPASTINCIQVLVRLMRFEEAAALLPRLGRLEDPEIAKEAIRIGINTNNVTLASEALQSRIWRSGEQLEKDAWLAQLALLQADRHGLLAAYEKLKAAGSLDLLGKSRRMAGDALGQHADAISGVWNWGRRGHIAESVPQLIQSGETVEGLAGKKVLIIAFTELGDEIYPLELIDRLRMTFASCTIVVDQRIAGLVARNRHELIVIGKEKRVSVPSDSPVPEVLRRHLGPEIWAEINHFDKVLLIQDFLALLVRTEADLPHRPKTLDAEPALRKKWRCELTRSGRRPRVGLFWRSGRLNYMRLAKSTVLKDWAPFLKGFQGSVISLQFGAGVSEEIAAFRDTFPVTEIPGLDTRDNLESVAALMSELDLVVTIPGTTMHLAGALGVRTLAVSHPSEFLQRTRLDGRTSIWSPAVEVVSGPWELGFEGAIAAATRRFQEYNWDR